MAALIVAAYPKMVRSSCVRGALFVLSGGKLSKTTEAEKGIAWVEAIRGGDLSTHNLPFRHSPETTTFDRRRRLTCQSARSVSPTSLS